MIILKKALCHVLIFSLFSYMVIIRIYSSLFHIIINWTGKGSIKYNLMKRKCTVTTDINYFCDGLYVLYQGIGVIHLAITSVQNELSLFS